MPDPTAQEPRFKSHFSRAALTAAFTPPALALAAALPLVGAGAGALSLKLAEHFGLLSALGLDGFSWWQAFLVGGVLAYGSGFIRGGSVLSTPWLSMLFLGAVHHDVSASVPALGFWFLVGLYLCALPLRLVLTPSKDSPSS
jgi:hypothetical protein